MKEPGRFGRKNLPGAGYEKGEYTMDCIDLFKRAAVALQTDPRYLAGWT